MRWWERVVILLFLTAILVGLFFTLPQRARSSFWNAIVSIKLWIPEAFWWLVNALFFLGNHLWPLAVGSSSSGHIDGI